MAVSKECADSQGPCPKISLAVTAAMTLNHRFVQGMCPERPKNVLGHHVLRNGRPGVRMGPVAATASPHLT